jgi:hypothetical protein
MKGSIEIERSAEEIFSYLEDDNKSDTYLNGNFRIHLLKSGANPDNHYHVGSLVKGEGCFLEQEMVKLLYRVKVVRPGRLVELKTEGGKFDSMVLWELEPLTPQKTLVSLQVTLNPKGGFLGNMVTLFRGAVDNAIKKYLRQSLLQLKQVIEQPVILAKLA